MKWLPGAEKFQLILKKEQKKAYAIAVLNQGLKVMSENFATGKIDEALKTIENTQNNIKEIYSNAQDVDVSLLMKQMSEYSINLTQLVFNKK